MGQELDKPAKASLGKTLALILMAAAALGANEHVDNLIPTSCAAQIFAVTAAARIHETYEDWQSSPVYFFAVLKHTAKYSFVMFLNVGIGLANENSGTFYGAAAASLFLSGASYLLKKCLSRPKPDTRSYEERRASRNQRFCESDPDISDISDIDDDSDSDIDAASSYGAIANTPEVVENIQSKRSIALFFSLLLPAIATTHSAFMAYQTGELKYQLSGQTCLAFLGSIWKRKYKFHHHPAVGLSSALYLTGRYAIVMLINAALGATQSHQKSRISLFLAGSLLIAPALLALKNHYRKHHDFHEQPATPPAEPVV